MAHTMWRKFKYIRNEECIWVSSNEADAPRAYYTEWSKSEKERKYSILTHIYIWNPERWLLMNLFIGQQWRHRHREETCEHSGGRRGWDELREQHWNIHITMCKVASQRKSVVWHKELKPGALWQPEVGWGGGGKGPYVYLRLIHVDVWQKPTQYCKLIILQLKINNYKNTQGNWLKVCLFLQGGASQLQRKHRALLKTAREFP